MKNIIQALNNVMKDVSYVQKSSENKFHGYKYASEAALLESLRPAMIQHGLILIPSIGNISPIDIHGNTMLTVEYTLAHISGEIWPDKIIAAGCGNDKSKSGSVGDKGIYKALTGANKYLLFKLFQIETGDDPEHDEAAVPIEQPKSTPAKAPTKKVEPNVITLEDKAYSQLDVDNYVEIFVAALLLSRDEKEVRTFWKDNDANRKKLAIEPNDAEYKKMSDACAERIKTLKGQ